ncbi:MAG: DMT family transporter [Synergistaceae bacterium]|nr:DMT family transporter [Synergistaceae bacterium]
MKTDRNELIGTLLVLAGGMCAGMTGTLQAFAPEGATPQTFGAARTVAAGIILSVWTLSRSGMGFFRQDWNWKGIVLSALGFAAYQMTFFSSVKFIGVAVGTMIAVGASPVIAGILGRLVFGEHLTKRWYAATALAIAGCPLLALGGGASSTGAVSLAGIALALGASLSYAFEGLGLKLAGKCDPFATVTAVYSLSGIFCLPWLILGDTTWMWRPRGIVVIILLALVCTVCSKFCFTSGLRRISFGKAYTLSLSEPVMAWALATVLLGERLSLSGVLGAALLFGGIILLACENKGGRQEKAEQPPQIG